MTLQRIARDIEAIVGRDRTVERPQAPTVGEPLLEALGYAVAERAASDAKVRELLAYARAFAGPHPYTLAELAEVCGMSVSWVRTAFGPADIAVVTVATGLEPVPGTKGRHGRPDRRAGGARPASQPPDRPAAGLSVEPAMKSLLYRPVGVVDSVAAGALSGRVFKKVSR
jgi:hypothetical protein